MSASILPPAGSWKIAQREAFTVLSDLLAHLRLDELDQTWIDTQFPLRVPRSFVARMQVGDAQDPLLLQVLPLRAEQNEHANFVDDPVADLALSPAPGLVHKYASRALVISAATCAVNCRYCFRRNYPYREATLNAAQLQQARNYLHEHSIDELILSGGDPLVMDDAKLQRILDALMVPSIKRLRIHSRTPIVLPERIDQGFISVLDAIKVPVVMVVHSNHANEWKDVSLRAAMHALKNRGVLLLNQAVLLAGINDSAAAQIALSEATFENGVLPYYLNLLDRARGTAHFEVDDATARDIHRTMQAALPGYLLPRLVRDEGSQHAKTIVL
jgi:L-lysine 2,3-aminomutase